MGPPPALPVAGGHRITTMHYQRSPLILRVGALVCVCLGMSLSVPASEPSAPALPSYQEVYDLIRANLPGMDDGALQRAALEGLLSRLNGRVSLAGTNVAGTPVGQESLRAKVLEDRFAYVHPGQVDTGTVAAITTALADLARTNRLQGGVLDLRFSRGTDYASAFAGASLWVAGTKPLLDWGEGVRSSSGSNPSGRIPWVVLVNGETSGAPEALAAALRQTESALLVGGRTAGHAAIAKEFPLQNGQRLRIAAVPVKTADGKAIPATGLVPDIEVRADVDTERALLDDSASRSPARPGAAASDAARRTPANGGSTNRPPRRRLNEADLVRMQKEGRQRQDLESGPGPDPGAPPEAVSGPQDPSLLRALDLLKGLAVVRQSRSE